MNLIERCRVAIATANNRAGREIGLPKIETPELAPSHTLFGEIALFVSSPISTAC